jgi:tryptophan synthase alpha subunit
MKKISYFILYKKILSDMNNIWYGCMQVLLTTPTTTADRMKEITEASEGFVYLVRTGV